MPGAQIATNRICAKPQMPIAIKMMAKAALLGGTRFKLFPPTCSLQEIAWDGSVRNKQRFVATKKGFLFEQLRVQVGQRATQP